VPVDHIGIAVKSLAEALPRWENAFGASGSPPEVVASQKVRASFVEVGDTEVELLEPTDPSSVIARFLETRGEGMHHIAFQVPQLDRTLEELGAKGYRLIDRVGRPGARGRRVGFVHPSGFGGVLLEFVERP
jgi:methylmalonyl-CoA epimerase